MRGEVVPGGSPRSGRTGQPTLRSTVSGYVQRFGNLFVIGLLRSRLHRLASGTLVLVTFRGRNTGRRFTLPVMYAERDGSLTIFVGHHGRKQWWRNLQGGADVDVRLRGQQARRRADIVTGTADVDTYLDRYPRARRTLAAADSPVFVRLAPSTTAKS
jgi:hypothetical protein